MLSPMELGCRRRGCLKAGERYLRGRRLGLQRDATLRLGCRKLLSSPASKIGIDQHELRADRLVKAPLSERFDPAFAGLLFRVVALEPCDDIADASVDLVVVT
jgi:hypothetical protein